MRIAGYRPAARARGKAATIDPRHRSHQREENDAISDEVIAGVEGKSRYELAKDRGAEDCQPRPSSAAQRVNGPIRLGSRVSGKTGIAYPGDNGLGGKPLTANSRRIGRPSFRV